MIVSPDDEIYRVDEVFLGPDRFRFPWRWTYRQYGVALGSFLLLQAAERQAGIPIGLWPALFALLGAAWIARAVQDGINWDRGLNTIWREFCLEVSGPREQKTGTRGVVSVSRVSRVRKASKNRTALLTEVYGKDEDTGSEPADVISQQSWWDQFRTKKRKSKNNESPERFHDREWTGGPRW